MSFEVKTCCNCKILIECSISLTKEVNRIAHIGPELTSSNALELRFICVQSSFSMTKYFGFARFTLQLLCVFCFFISIDAQTLILKQRSKHCRLVNTSFSKTIMFMSANRCPPILLLSMISLNLNSPFCWQELLIRVDDMTQYNKSQETFKKPVVAIFR